MISFAQAPLEISYNLPGNIDANALSPIELANSPKEYVIDLHFSAPSVRMVMESLDGLTNYLDHVFPLEVQAFPDSTYVYGKPGAWTIGLGHFEGLNEFQVKVINAQGQGNAVVAQGTYP